MMCEHLLLQEYPFQESGIERIHDEPRHMWRAVVEAYHCGHKYMDRMCG